MILKHKLLDHPFYKAWKNGEVTLQQLSSYARSYNEFITLIPEYWGNVIRNLNPENSTGKKIIEEEKNHITLWSKWSEKLPTSDSYPSMKNEIDIFNKMNTSELLGALHSFEIQQPDVAKTKKSGLINHYGFRKKDLKYFDEHMKEAKHIKYSEYLYNNFADKDEFKRGFTKGARLLYNSLDKYLN